MKIVQTGNYHFLPLQMMDTQKRGEIAEFSGFFSLRSFSSSFFEKRSKRAISLAECENEDWPRISRPLFALNPFYTMGGFSLAPLSRSIFVGTNYKSFLHQRMPSWPSNSWRRILTFEKEEVCNSFGPAPSSRETARNFSGIATESGEKSSAEPFRKTGRARFPPALGSHRSVFGFSTQVRFVPSLRARQLLQNFRLAPKSRRVRCRMKLVVQSVICRFDT